MAQAPKNMNKALIPQHKRMAMGMPVNKSANTKPSAKTPA